MTPQTAPDGIILFAHGSRDPLWRAPIEAVATRIRVVSAQTRVSCAYLELCEPGLPDACAAMLQDLRKTIHPASSAQASLQANGRKPLNIRIVPMFLGMGKHAREDLPQLAIQLRQTHPDVSFEIVPTIGEDERVTALLAQVAMAF